MGCGFLSGSSGGGATVTGNVRKPLGQNLGGLMDPATRDKSLGAFSLDPSQIGNISSAYKQFSDPNYLDVASSPYVKNLLAALTSNSNTNLDRNLANLRSQFGAAGQFGAGSSSPLAMTEAQTIEQSNQDLNNLISQALFGQFQRQQGLQLQGLGAAGQQNLLPANLLALLGPLLSKNKGQASSPLGALAGLAGGAGGLASGLGSLGVGGGGAAASIPAAAAVLV